jgi:signal transduction histidine kinase
MHLRNRLLLLILSVLLPAFVTAGVAIFYVYQEEQKSQEKAMVEAARAFALLVNTELQTKEWILRTLTKSPALANGDWHAFYDYAREISPSTETTIIVMRADGAQLLNTRRPFGAPLPKSTVSNLPELGRKRGDDNTLVSDVFVASVGKRFDFAIRVPVKVDDRLPYFLVMGVNAAELDRVMTAQGFPQQWIATIVDRQGKVVTRSRETAQYVGKPVSDYSRRILSSATEGVYPSVALDGVPVKVFFSHLALADWRAMISIPEADIRRSAVKAASFMAAGLVVLLAFSVLAARRLARLVTTPIYRLGVAAERLGRGEDVDYMPHGMREADTVGQIMVQASLKIQRANADLQQRVDEAVAATRHAERALLQSRKLEALGRLTGGIAHEFNNVLQTLTTCLQLAGLTTQEPRTRGLLQTGRKAVERAAELTRQLSAFGRIQDARIETVDLGERITGFLPLIAGTLPGDIAFHKHFEDAGPVTLDPLQLELALLNIALNARDAMPAGGILTLMVGKTTLIDGDHGLLSGEYAHIRMTDTGAGMTSEELSHAMDPFYTTKEIGKGSGLGLSQAYAFAVQAGGTLVLSSQSGKGTTVDIYLPKAAGPMSTSSAPASATENSRPSLNSGSILFVEDDPLVREAVIPALEEAGFMLRVAESGDQALDMLSENHGFDFLFSDVVMPGGISGIELAKEVKRRFPHMKIILATGYSDERVNIPGVHLLAKPYDVSSVIARLTHSAEAAQR